MIVLDSTQTATTVVLQPLQDIPLDTQSVEIELTSSLNNTLTLITGTIVGTPTSRRINISIPSNQLPSGVVQGVARFYGISSTSPTWGSATDTWGDSNFTYAGVLNTGIRTLLETDDIRIIR